jgi:uncharacterized protein YllA (UPF0747 family)
MTSTLRLPLAQYPGMNRFVLDWMAGEERATRLLPRREASPRASGRGVDAALADALVASNRAWGLDVSAAVSRWRSGEALALVAGQQVGFAGGPLYTLTKIATLIRLRRDLEKQGIPATAFFWMATEDHDFDEVATLTLPVRAVVPAAAVDRQRDLVCTRAARRGELRSAVGQLPGPESLTAALVAQLGIERPSWLREGITFRDSFAELIASVFGSEIVLVDSLLPELRCAGAPLFEQIRSRRDELQAALRRRGAEIEAAGYREQVVARDGEEYTLLFELDEEGRRIPLDASKVVAPERISTSAITRPLLQDFALQPDLFVGGPAEVAYYAQIAALHPLLGVSMPRVALRGHLLLAPQRVLRTIGRYAIEPHEIFSSPEQLVAAREPEGVEAIRAITEAAKIDLLEQIGRISEIALPADKSLTRSFQRSVGHLEYHFDKLSERAVRALLRKEKDRWTATCELVGTLYPDGKVQERAVSWLPLWLEYGQALVEGAVAAIEPDANGFTIAGL